MFILKMPCGNKKLYKWCTVHFERSKVTVVLGLVYHIDRRSWFISESGTRKGPGKGAVQRCFVAEGRERKKNRRTAWNLSGQTLRITMLENSLGDERRRKGRRWDDVGKDRYV